MEKQPKKIAEIMKKIFFLFIVVIIIFLPSNFSFKMEGSTNSFNSIFKLSAEDSVWVESTFSKLTLREKCAQMIFANVSSRSLDTASKEYDDIIKLVSEHKIGGVVYFSGSIKEQIDLTNKLQNLSDIPLMISADYERGLGMRLSDAVEFPFNMAFGATGDTYLSYLAGKVTAIESRAIGVHQNYAPLVDVNTDYRNPIINVRAYSEDPLEIAYHSMAYIRGMHEGKMISSAKHFPGHGATDLDSHKELPFINRSKEEFEKTELIPFKLAIKSGVKSVMVGHLQIPSLTEADTLPATLSNKVITELLKNELGFSGLVVTDAMNMHAISHNYSTYDAMKMAVNAGNNIITYPEDEIESINELVKAVENNDINIELINSSVKKILSAKKWLGLDKEKIVDSAKVKQIVINNVDHRRLAQEIAEKSVTLVKDDNNIIPVDPSNYYKTACLFLAHRTSPYSDEDIIPFDKYVKENFNYVKTHKLILKSRKPDFEKAYADAKNSNLILLPVFLSIKSFEGKIQLDSLFADFIKRIIKLKKPTILISFGNPYLLSDVPESPAYLCTYGSVQVSQKAAMDALLGRINISGRLPISIPNTKYIYKSGIQKKRLTLNFLKDKADTNYNFENIDSLMSNAVNDSVFPGGVLLVAQRGKVIFHKPYGRYTYDKDAVEISQESMFDMASLTKVVGTTCAAMFLYDEGKLKLDEYVNSYLPEFGVNGKQKVTVKNLLLHNSGLDAFKPYYKYYSDGESVIRDIMNSKLNSKPGEKYVYSDLGIITLQKVIEKITGLSIDNYLKEKLFDPLKLSNIMYNPPAEYQYYCVPSEVDGFWRHILVKGKVHDETSFLLNGVAGHAGLFSTAHDAAVIIETIMNKGNYNGKQIFKSETVEEWTSIQDIKSGRGFGWDTKSEGYSSAGTKFSENSFGHTGFTGTSIWADKNRDLFVILLTNRVYPTRDNKKIIEFRPVLHDAVIDAVDYF